jgi:GAF domain-containing protein/HAMP domain-containing protein
MRTRAFRYNPLSWSIWVKLLVGFGLVLLLLAIPAALLLRSSIVELGAQSARTFVAQNGSQQVNAITNALNLAEMNLHSFADNAANQRLLTGLLIDGVQSGIELNFPDVRRDEMENLFVRSLLNPATSLFENVRLLDREGRVLASARATLTAGGAQLSDDESSSPAYLAALATQGRGGDTTLLSVSLAETPNIEYVHLLRWRDGTVFGYLVGKVNNARTFFNNMRLEENVYQGLTYLANARGNVITADPNDTARAAFNRSVAARALIGQSGVEIYTSEHDEQAIGFYSPIRGTQLVLVTQVYVDQAVAQTQEEFATRIFVGVVGALGLLAVVVLLLNQLIAPPLARLRHATQQFSEGDFGAVVYDVERGDEIGDLANAFVNMREAVRELIGDLESRIAARTRDMKVTQEISRFAATQRDLQTLMDNVVNLIVERFGSLYHAQIFLIDADREYAVVRASTGEIGAELIARGHRLAVGSVSVIGQVTEQGRYILARDTAVSQVHRRNEFLTETRAELAIPLRVGDDIIGALDVQSKQPDVFTEDLINVLQTLADQIAIAIQNARLYEESLRRVSEIEESNRQSTLRAWQEYMRDQRLTQLAAEAGVTTDTNASELRRAALAQGDLVVGSITDRQTIPIALPIRLRGQTLGAVEWELPAVGFGEDKLELARDLANRLALSLDNARLFQESRRATERERLVNTIATKLTAQTNIDTILQTAVREVGQALRAPQVSIRLNTQQPAANGSGSARQHENGNPEV